MTSQETASYLARSLRIRYFVGALLVLCLGHLPTGDVRGAEDAADPYDTLYDVIMTRYGPGGKAYAQNETSPAIFAWSEFPFDDKTFKKFVTALDAFSALPQEKLEKYSEVKRALLQRHLWSVFDTTFDWHWPKDSYWGGRKSFPKTHVERRTAIQPVIVSLIRRLALTKDQILALPDTLAATIKSGGFARTHDPAKPFKPFLPADIYTEESSWICISEKGEGIPADIHTGKLRTRSMFLVFMRLPGGRAETLEYIERRNKRSKQFPVGTQFALLEQPFLISKEGELILSPMIVSVQLRAYLNVGRRFKRSDNMATQCVAEFVMQPRELMKRNAVMRALGPSDFRYEAGAPFAAGFSPKDPFAKGAISGGMPRTTRLNLCMSCHRSAGTRGLMTQPFFGKSVSEGNVEEISKATAAQKRGDDQWKTLQAHWQAKSPREIDVAKLLELPKLKSNPEEQPKRKPVAVTPKDPQARLALVTRMEAEVVDVLNKVHTAVLRAEVARLSEMFQLKEADTSKLRSAAQDAAKSAIEKTRASLRSRLQNNVTLQLDGDDVDMTAFKLNGRFIFLDAASTDKDVKTFHKHLYNDVKRRVSNVWFSVGFAGARLTDVVGPRDPDVQNEELWRNALSAVLTKDQLKRYTEQLGGRFKSTVVTMILTALQFDLDLLDSQLPIVRRRIEERINPDPAGSFFIERIVRRIRQRVEAEDLADILPKEQLTQLTAPTKSQTKSKVVTMILTALQFDLHLQDSQLPVVRKRLEQRVNPGTVRGTIESASMRIRWKLKAEDFADILTEPQRTLWRLTQGE